MSFPTPLSPWFVVQRLRPLDGDGLEFYRSTDEGMGMFDPSPEQAMLFTNLFSASRVAHSEVAHIRLLTSKEDAKEFAR
jgi:hypothetical protein